MAVVRPQAPPRAQPAPAVGAFRGGFFLATGRLPWKLTADFTGRTGGSWGNAIESEWYLFSDDGRLQRRDNLPDAPGGDIRRFDYGKAARADPGNASTYSVQGGRILLSIKNGAETIDAHLLPGGDLEIRDVTFKHTLPNK